MPVEKSEDGVNIPDQSTCIETSNEPLGVMSASGGTKRRRRRDKAFLQFYETFSLHATIAAVTGSIAFLAWVAIRSL